MNLTAEQIAKANKFPHEDVPIEEWSGSVRVTTITAGQRDEYEDSIYSQDGDGVKVNRQMFRAKLLVHALVTEEGKRLYKSPEQIAALAAKPVQKLYEVAQKLNGLGTAAQQEIEKNSPGEGESTSS